jgi:hypothetical protein
MPVSSRAKISGSLTQVVAERAAAKKRLEIEPAASAIVPVTAPRRKSWWARLFFRSKVSRTTAAEVDKIMLELASMHRPRETDWIARAAGGTARVVPQVRSKAS